MDHVDPSGPNVEQIRFWNEVGGPKWRAWRGTLERLLAPLGAEVMDRAAVGAGERVLDVGCGCGETAIEIARRVGEGGSVVGVDVSEVMLEAARAAAEAAGRRNVRFVAADAQTEDFGAERFDVIYSRFGVMFFADPVAAFANLGRSLRPGGRVAFVCWQKLDRNPWVMAPLDAAGRHLQLPQPPPPGAPGPFSFGDPDRVRSILEGAGLGKVEVAPWSGTLSVGSSLAEAVELLLDIGPVATLLREQAAPDGAACLSTSLACGSLRAAPDGAACDLRARVVEAMRAALAPFDTGAGLRVPAAAWIVQSHP
jgi:SAM-dependent methyltransferase